MPGGLALLSAASSSRLRAFSAVIRVRLSSRLMFSMTASLSNLSLLANDSRPPAALLSESGPYNVRIVRFLDSPIAVGEAGSNHYYCRRAVRLDSGD